MKVLRPAVKSAAAYAFHAVFTLVIAIQKCSHNTSWNMASLYLGNLFSTIKPPPRICLSG